MLFRTGTVIAATVLATTLRSVSGDANCDVETGACLELATVRSTCSNFIHRGGDDRCRDLDRQPDESTM